MFGLRACTFKLNCPIIRFILTRVTYIVDQVLHTMHVHVHVFSRSCFVFLSFFLWLLHRPSFGLRLLIVPLVSSQTFLRSLSITWHISGNASLFLQEIAKFQPHSRGPPGFDDIDIRCFYDFSTIFF